MKNRAELDADLDSLEASMPMMMEATQATDQMEEFSSLAQAIQDAAGPDDKQHVWTRLQSILRENQLIPGEDEPAGA